MASDGGPAFPTDDQERQGGMSLRDYFAGQALAGLMALPVTGGDDPLGKFAAASYEMADAMLKARGEQ